MKTKLITILTLALTTNLSTAQNCLDITRASYTIENAKERVISWHTSCTTTFTIASQQRGGWVTIDTVPAEILDDGIYRHIAVFDYDGNHFQISDESGTFTKNIQFKDRTQPDDWSRVITTNLDFGSVTTYEIYDGNGIPIMKGRAASVDLKRLRTGEYYVNANGVITQFHKNKRNTTDANHWSRKVTDNITLRGIVSYEIYDEHRNLMLSGTGESVSVKDLIPEHYYLKVGEEVTPFVKRDL